MFAKAKNNKRFVVYIVLAIALIGAGVTYAWFTATTPPLTTELELGDMDIEGTFDADPGDFLFEPGLEIDIAGTVKNTGSLPFIAKIDIDAVSTLVRDTNGDPLPSGGTRTINDDPCVKVDFLTDELYSMIYPDDKVHIWLYDPETGDYYLVLDPGVELEVDFLAVLDGELMGTEYMNSTISFDSKWLATQVLEGSVKSAWGDDVDIDELMANMIPLKASGRMMSAAAGDPNAYLVEYLEKLFNR